MIDSDTFAVFSKILFYSNFLPFLFSWIKLKIPSYLLPLRILFVVSYISTLALGYFHRSIGNNLFIGVSYVTIEYLIFSRIYWIKIPDDGLKVFIKYCSILLGVFAVVNLFFIQGIFNENSYTRSILSIMTILLAFMYFWSMLNSLNVENLYRDPMFWLNCGILLYASASFSVFLFSGYLQNTKDYGPLRTFWTLKNIMGILRNVFFTYAFWLNFKQSRMKSSS